MQTPTLTIIAGCNGSGKSTFSNTYVKTKPFDYDKRYLEIYNSLLDSELREKFAKDKTTKEFESMFNHALSNKQNFCYETNFDTYPIENAMKAKNAGFKLHLYFFCLLNLDLAKKRVKIRTANHGHFITDDTIEYKRKKGYENLDTYFNFFDYILLIDNSKKLEVPKNLFSLTKNIKGNFSVEFYSNLPNYAHCRYPKIYDIIEPDL